jgi:hypothetical protein
LAPVASRKPTPASTNRCCFASSVMVCATTIRRGVGQVLRVGDELLGSGSVDQRLTPDFDECVTPPTWMMASGRPFVLAPGSTRTLGISRSRRTASRSRVPLTFTV